MYEAKLSICKAYLLIPVEKFAKLVRRLANTSKETCVDVSIFRLSKFLKCNLTLKSVN